MKQLRLVLLVIAATAWSAAAVFASPPEKGASAANAKGSCSAHGANASAAAMDCCAGKGTSASAASAATGSCAAHGARTAAMAKGAVGCGAAGAMAGMGHCDTKGAAMHGDCAVCTDEATCSSDLRGAGVRAQVVPLRNGAMIVYTAENAVSVRALQTTVARYNEHIMNAYAGGDDANLCGGCKSFRGAMASGKFSRELVNVKNGCQILLTSTDRNIVRKIHDSMGTQVAARIRT